MIAMKVKPYIPKILFAIGILMLLLVASSCAKEEDSVSLYVVKTGSGAGIPAVSGLSDDDAANQKLKEIFTPYADRALQTIEASHDRLKVVYDLAPSEDSNVFGKKYDIKMSVSNDTDSLEIMTVHISGADDVKIDAPENLDWLDSADLTESAIFLKHAGLEVDLSNLDEEVGEEFAVQMFIRLYEAFAGEELDVSDIKVGDSGGDMLKKALKLNLITAYGNYEYEYASEAYLYSVVNMADAMMNDIERDVYGRQSEAVTGKEFAAMLRTVYNVCRVHEPEDSNYSWSLLGEVDFQEAAKAMELENDYGFSRRDGAEMVGRITNAGPKFSRNYTDDDLYTVEDSESIWVRRAVTYGFMGYYGSSVLFAPDEDFTVTDAVENAKTYMMSRYLDWSFATNYEWNGVYTKADILTAVGKTAAYFADRPEEDKFNFETKTIINDRDYNWFFSQKNTGALSSVNCMPSIAAMAAHWYDETSTVTVQDMRNTSNTADGWRVDELRHALEVYHIPYASDIAGIDRFVSTLDEGKIILVQYSDRPVGVTGHCYVVYGYKKVGNSVTFIINDADSLVYRSEIFGRPNGNGDEVEAKFGMWSIIRFQPIVTTVGQASD